MNVYKWAGWGNGANKVDMQLCVIRVLLAVTCDFSKFEADLFPRFANTRLALKNALSRHKLSWANYPHDLFHYMHTNGNVNKLTVLCRIGSEVRFILSSKYVLKWTLFDDLDLIDIVFCDN